jgi:hypothetical protein
LRVGENRKEKQREQERRWRSLQGKHGEFLFVLPQHKSQYGGQCGG